MGSMRTAWVGGLLGVLLLLAVSVGAIVGPPPAPEPTATPTTSSSTGVASSPSPTPDVVLLRSCEGLGTLRERIQCRVRLPETEEAAQQPYTPEECRDKRGEERRQCLFAYDSTARCFHQSSDALRDACAKRALGIGELPLGEQVRRCRQLDDNQSAACLAELRSGWYWLIKFRMYNLEYKAQELIEKGVLEDTAVDFIVRMEQLKLAFNNGVTPEAKREVLLTASEAWNQFRLKAQQELASGAT